MSLLALDDVSFGYGRREVLSEVSLSIEAGCSVGLVGESGAGKSTILRLMLGLASPRTGRVLWDGALLVRSDRTLMRRFRAAVQPVFQDPYSSLDPRQRIDRIVGEPLRSLRLASGDAARERVAEAVASVGLDPDVLTRYPQEFSGGQRQRIAIARAVVSRPRVLLADEPVSALDVSTRVQVLGLLDALAREHGSTLVMVSHDLTAIASACERTVVLRGGRVVEAGRTADILRHPREAYTRDLIAAVPRLRA